VPDPLLASDWSPSSAFWSGRPVAVTGATGFVGAHLTSALVALGAEVAVLRRDETPAHPLRSAWVDRVAVVSGGLEDHEVVERLLVEYGSVTVFHLAAQSQVGVANANPRSTFEANVRGTWNVLEAARRAPTVGQVVAASSDKAYGAQPTLPYTEQSPLLARHPYDVSKACADLIATCYAQCFDVPVVTTRCGNFYGPGDLNWARLVPGTIRSVLSGERPLVRSDGTMVRDYLYVQDGVRAYLMLAEALERDPSLAGRAFNFSLEEPLSVLEVIARVQKAAGTSLEPDVRATARHEIQEQFLSAEQARTVLGWAPAHTLDGSLTETVEWYRRYLQSR
jgi:CDP-glucose 4,6-dehydratase